MRYSFIYQQWWKWLTLIVLLYVFIAGFRQPLRPGILDTDIYELTAGENYSVDVTTYNTFLNEDGREISGYLKLDSVRVAKVPYVMVRDRSSINLRGTLPPLMEGEKSATATLIIHDSKDGYLLLPFAFTIQGSDAPDDLDPDLNWNDTTGAYDQDWSFRFPFIAILYETIRNTFFHVAIWMAMFVLLIISLIYSIKYLQNKDLIHDAIASSFATVAVLFGMMGMVTGSIWAKATWGTFWTDDPKLNMAAVAMLIYLAYTIVRAAISDSDKRARVTAAYNIFAFVAMIPLIFIIPRLTDGLHPGNGGNPALGGEDLDSTLRLIFYPAIVGYTLIGVWMASLQYRLRKIELDRIKFKLSK